MGWAVLDANGNWMASGEWDLSPNRFEGGGMRYVKCQSAFRKLLFTFSEVADGVVVGMEEVPFIKHATAAQVYGGLMASLQTICEELDVPYQGRPVKTVKRLATGNGNAGKPAMVKAALERWGHADTNNEADALWVAESLRLELQ